MLSGGVTIVGVIELSKCIGCDLHALLHQRLQYEAIPLMAVDTRRPSSSYSKVMVSFRQGAIHTGQLCGAQGGRRSDRNITYNGLSLCHPSWNSNGCSLHHR